MRPHDDGRRHESAGRAGRRFRRRVPPRSAGPLHVSERRRRGAAGAPRGGSAGPSVAVACFPATRGSVVENHFREVLADGRPRQFEYRYEPQNRWYEVRAFPDPGGPRRLLPGRRRPPPRRPAARRRDPAADRRPRGAAVGDRPGRRGRPHPHRQPGLGGQRGAAPHQRDPARRGGRRLPVVDVPRRCGRPTTPRSSSGITRLRAEPDGASGDVRLRVLRPARSVAQLVPAAGGPGRGLDPGRGHPHRHHRAGARASRPWPGGPGTTS